MGWWYSRGPKGMFSDRHGRFNVVEFWQKILLPFFKKILKQMVLYDCDGNAEPLNLCCCPGYLLKKCVVLVMHDKSTFYTNDCQDTWWVGPGEDPTPHPKLEGASIMVSDFALLDLGWLKSCNGYGSFNSVILHANTLPYRSQEVHIYFKAGKNREGWFNTDDLLKQVTMAIDLFEDNFLEGSAIGTFGFDNALLRSNDTVISKSFSRLLYLI
jgi:hypothetical protein